MNVADYRKLTKPKSKYRNVPMMIDGIRFASKAEAKRYEELKLLQKVGDVNFFLRQVPFHLPGNIRYVCDFFVFWKDGTFSVWDVKGFETPKFKRDKKQVESLYPVAVEVVK